MTETVTQTQSQDFARFVDLQQQHTHITTKLEELEITINKAAQIATARNIPEFVVLQEEVTRLEKSVKELFEKHPEWRGDAKSVKTPYGSVEQRSSEELEIPNEGVTVVLIKQREKVDPNFKAADHLHVEESPNKEALGRCKDDVLTELGISRVKKESITVKPAKVNVKQALKAAKQPAKQEAA